MQVSGQRHRDEVRNSWGFFSLVYVSGLWFYCNKFINHLSCISILLRFIFIGFDSLDFKL